MCVIFVAHWPWRVQGPEKLTINIFMAHTLIFRRTGPIYDDDELNSKNKGHPMFKQYAYYLKVIYHPLYGMNNYVLTWVIGYHVTLSEGHMIANHPI